MRRRGWVSLWARLLALVLVAGVVAVWQPVTAVAATPAGSFVSLPPKGVKWSV